MFQTQSYPVPPPQYLPADYTPPSSSSSGARYGYYSARYGFNNNSSPLKTSHVRRATQDYGDQYYSTPSKKAYHTTPEKGAYYTATATPRKAEYVSDSRYHYKNSRTPFDEGEVVYEYLPRYERYQANPPSYNRGNERKTDQARYTQVPIYGSAETKTRPRRASNTGKPTYYSSASRPRPNTSSGKQTRTATEEDARNHHIPAGYSYKNWDPNEEPILLLGSVFDANSLGKWIYDWTVFFYGASTPMAELAGELWLSLIQLADKVKSAEEVLGRVRQQKNRDMIDEFLDSGERLWSRFNRLLKICENYMWKAAKRECADAKHITMGKTSGCEFVDSIFGRDRELERTEKLMTGIRLWSLRYTANVDPILADPLA